MSQPQNFLIKEETKMKLYGAIDLHSNNNVTVLINEKDEVVYRKRLPNDLKLILGQLAAHQSSIEGIVVESTYNWYWLVDGLMERGHRVHLANTAAIEQYSGLKYTDDDSDARWLAHLLRLGVLPPIQHLLRRWRVSAGLVGRILLIEHGRSDCKWLGCWQDGRADSFAKQLGCHWNREPLKLARQAGVRVNNSRRICFGVFSYNRRRTRYRLIIRTDFGRECLRSIITQSLSLLIQLVFEIGGGWLGVALVARRTALAPGSRWGS
jgi:Transposase